MISRIDEHEERIRLGRGSEVCYLLAGEIPDREEERRGKGQWPCPPSPLGGEAASKTPRLTL